MRGVSRHRGNAFYNSLREQAAAQGITVIVAAGDYGSAGCDGMPNQTAAQTGLAIHADLHLGRAISPTPAIAVTVNKENSQTQVGLVTFDSFGNEPAPMPRRPPMGPPMSCEWTSPTARVRAALPVRFRAPTGNVTITDNGNPPLSRAARQARTPGPFHLEQCRPSRGPIHPVSHRAAQSDSQLSRRQ